MKTGDELVSEISSRKPGSKIKLTLVRNGKNQDATVTVADRANFSALVSVSMMRKPRTKRLRKRSWA